jgi:hypothetical protein
MVKLLVIGITVLLATLGGSYGALLFSADTHGEPVKKVEVMQQVKLDPISVPVVRGGKIGGYVLVRSAFTASEAELKTGKDMLTLYFTEALFKTIYEEPAFDFTAMKPVQLDAFRKRVLASANGRLGQEKITDAAFESLNFLTAEEVRSH